MATKAEVNKVLRKHGLANIKMQTGEYGKEQTYRNSDGKMVKGIRYTTSGPLDCFLNISGRRKIMFEAITTDLKAIGCIVDGTWITVSQTNKKTTYLELWDEKFATYTRSTNLDPDYKSHYLVPSFHVEDRTTAL